MSAEPEPFGKYFLIDRIAVGGMAEIFRAKFFGHGGFEKSLVIKRILPSWCEDENFIEMFVDEAKLSVVLSHHNIVQVLDFGRIRNRWFIAMERVDGQDLRALLKELVQHKRELPPDLAAYIIHEAAAGLGYAHGKKDPFGKELGIIHRDISPSNLLLSYEGEVKVADFGVALTGDAEHSAAVDSKGPVGKFDYMSPEQARNETLDPRSDLFSLGIVLWEALTLRRLFRGATIEDTIQRVQGAPIPPPSSINPRVPAQLEAICMKLLQRGPTQRFPDALTLQDELLRFLLPQTPSRLRRSFAGFMAEMFADRIDEDRRTHGRTEVRASSLARMDAEATERRADEVTQPGIVLGEARDRPWILAGVALTAVLIYLLFLLMKG